MEGEFAKEMKYSIIKQQLIKVAIDYSFASFKEFKKHIVDDDVEIIEHVKNNIDTEKNIDRVIEFCESLKTELFQDAIALEINGEMYFI